MATERATSHWSDPLATNDDREQFVELVQYHFAHGLLGDDELHDRLDRVLAARTLGDLYRICRDLPFPAPGEDPPARRFRGGRS